MDPEALIRDYFRCFRDCDRPRLEELLTPAFRHLSPFARYEDRDRMLDEIWPHVGRTWAVDIQVFGAHPEFMVRYHQSGEHQSWMAEYIRFEGERIAEIEVFIGRA